MDLVLNATDYYFFDGFYASVVPQPIYPYFYDRSSLWRQMASIWLLEEFGVFLLYFLGSSIAYYCLFDQDTKKHPKYLKNQIAREIWLSVSSFPLTGIVTVPWLLFEVRGYSKLYSNIDDYGWPYFIFSIFWFILFTDFGVYWIHRFVTLLQ